MRAYKKFSVAFLSYIAVLVVPVIIVKILNLVLLSYPIINKVIASAIIGE